MEKLRAPRSYLIRQLNGGVLRRNTWHLNKSSSQPDRLVHLMLSHIALTFLVLCYRDHNHSWRSGHTTKPWTIRSGRTIIPGKWKLKWRWRMAGVLTRITTVKFVGDVRNNKTLVGAVHQIMLMVRSGPIPGDGDL